VPDDAHRRLYRIARLVRRLGPLKLPGPCKLVGLVGLFGLFGASQFLAHGPG
jgi:hypothetical protein